MTTTPSGPNKRIAFVAPTLAGVLRNRSNLIRAVKKQGHTVLVAAPSQMAGEIATLHHLGAEHRNFESNPPGMALLANWRIIKQLRELLQSWQAGTVIVEGSGLASIAAVAARKAGADRIITVASDIDAKGTSAAKYSRAVKLSRAVFCHNSTQANALMEALRLPPARQPVVTAGDGIDLDVFAPLSLPPPETALTFIMIADPDQRTAIETYTAAARALASADPTIRFELATDRETAGDTSLLTAEGIIFHGRAADPASLLKNAHVAVHLSADDGCPTALKQALAAGRPILTLDVPGCCELVDERVNGCLVPQGDAAALQAALLSFVRQRNLIPSEARAARVKAERTLGSTAVLPPILAAILE